MKRIYTQERTGEVGRTVLGVVAIAGIIGIGMVAPNVLQLLPYTPLFRAQRRNYVNSVVGRCIERGLLKREEKHGIGTVLRLTPKGEALLTRYQLKEITIPKPKRWDKKYRIIIFDIKEARRSTRNMLRMELLRLGFIRLQHSVWVHPYECQEVVILLKANLHIGKDVLYIIADSVENDRWLKEEFGLA